MSIKPVYKLPAAPFAAWLREQLRKDKRQEFATQVEVDPVWLDKMARGEYKTVKLDDADNILCKHGRTHIRELYPNLYDEE